jgi:hypothetical protein
LYLLIFGFEKQNAKAHQHTHWPGWHALGMHTERSNKKGKKKVVRENRTVKKYW